MAYQPDPLILERYADVLVNYALGHGQGIKRGDVVRLAGAEDAKPLFVACWKAILEAGGLVVPAYTPTGVDRMRLDSSSEEQLQTFIRPYWKGLADAIDHNLVVFSSADPHELEGADQSKLALGMRTLKPFRDWLTKKENAGRFSWTVGLYPTAALAKEARLSLRDYWQQVIDACYLDDPQPIKRWRAAAKEIARVKARLDKLEIVSLHVEADDVDLHVQLGPGRKWLGGDGANIPSFEVFISPDWRGTEGRAHFSEPLYHYGSLVEDIELRFEKGVVVAAQAKRGQDVLEAMLATDPGARRLGEFSLTDGRLSRITRFMAETLYDENRGGEQGNFHVALGMAYQDSYPGELSALKQRDWARLGYNDSAIHTDVISTTRRTVTATLPSGRQKVVYQDGRFVV